MKRVHLSEFTTQEIAQISDGCGVMARGLKVPDFIFSARCDLHDVSWCRGTGYKLFSGTIWLTDPFVWYAIGVFWLQRANVIFWWLMLADAWNPRYQILEKMAYTLLATIYFIAVFFVALVPHTGRMTSWRTKEETIAYAQSRKV